MGIDYEVKAFFDILLAIADKYNFTFPEDKNIGLAKTIHEKIKDKSKYSDWHNRADIKAEMQVDIILLLAQFRYPLSKFVCPLFVTTNKKPFFSVLFSDINTFNTTRSI